MLSAETVRDASTIRSRKPSSISSAAPHQAVLLQRGKGGKGTFYFFALRRDRRQHPFSWPPEFCRSTSLTALSLSKGNLQSACSPRGEAAGR